MFVIPVSGISQEKNDEELVRQTANSWFNSFNKHDFSDLPSYTTEDCFGINPLGRYAKLTKETPAIFNKAHEVFLKNLSIKVDSIGIRFIDSDVAIATVFSQEIGVVYPPDGIDRGNNKLEGAGLITTMVIVKRQKKWLITQYQSTHIFSPGTK